jgi:hypothetical protein
MTRGKSFRFLCSKYALFDCCCCDVRGMSSRGTSGEVWILFSKKGLVYFGKT